MFVKPLVLATSMALLAAIAGPAAARPQHSAMQHSSHAAMSASDHQTSGTTDGIATPPEASMHRYTGGPKSND